MTTRQRANGVLRALLASIAPVVLIAFGWLLQDHLALARSVSALDARLAAQERMYADLSDRLSQIERKIDRLTELLLRRDRPSK